MLTSEASPLNSKELKASCRIEIDDPHISAYASKYRGKKEVKVNVRSICNVLQTRVQLTVKIYKTTFFGNRLVAQSTTNPADPKSNGRTVLNYGTSALCKNDKKTNYLGIAYASAIIAGKKQYANKTQSRKIIPINCGT